MDFNTAYDNYYAILNSSYCEGDMKVDNIPNSPEFSLVTETNNLIETFQGMVQSLKDHERSKEKIYLTAWLNKLEKGTDENGRKLTELLKPLILGDPPNFTQAFQLIELWRQGFIQQVSSVQQIYNDWYKEYIQYANISIKTAAAQAVIDLGNSIVNLTPPQLVNKIIEGIEENWQKNYNKSGNGSIETFEKFMEKFTPYLTSIVNDMKEFRKKETKTKGVIDPWSNGATLGTIFKIKDPKDLTQTVQDKVIQGLVNGLSQEILLVAFGEGASTARASRQLKTLNHLWKQGAENIIKNVPTETDVYVTLTNELEVNPEFVNKIANFQQDSEIQKLVTNSDYKNHFIIHYSSKDLTIAEHTTSSVSAKVKGEGGLGSKVVGLQELGNAAGKSDEVHNLIFKAINVGHQLLYESNASALVDKISIALASLTFGFMFDDFERQFEHIQNLTQGNNTELNIYMISGNYYPVSDILQILYNYVDDLYKDKGNFRKKFIDVGFKPSTIDVVKTINDKRKKFRGQELWDAVRDAVLADAKMKILMATSYLKDLAYAIQDGYNS